METIGVAERAQCIGFFVPASGTGSGFFTVFGFGGFDSCYPSAVSVFYDGD